MKFDRQTVILIAVKLAIAIIIGSVVIYNIDTIELRYIVKNADVSFIILAAALLPVNLFLQYRKWKYLVDGSSAEAVPSSQIWISVILGISFGFITPGRIGELGKLFAIKNADRLKLLSVSVIEKIYDTFPVIIFGAISLPLLPHLFFTDSGFMRTNLTVFTLICAGIVFFAALHPGIFKVIINYTGTGIFRHSARFKRFTDGLKGFRAPGARILLFLSSLLFFVYTTQFVLLIFAFGDIDILHAYAGVWAAMLIKTFLPVSLGDIGVREGTAAYVFNLMSFPAAASVSAAFLLFVINILIPASAGIFAVPFISKRNRSQS
jgi:uncharacterized membrane protein YbhN (UPF0104 family)